MRKSGMVSPAKVARLLDVHINTVYLWCRKAVAGEPTKLKNVERHAVTGYYWIDLKEVEALKEQDSC